MNKEYKMKRSTNSCSESESEGPKLFKDGVTMTSEQDLQELSKLKEGNQGSVPLPPLNFGDAPIFYPTEIEFQDPLGFLSKIYDTAAEYGICKIVPPSNWTPPFSINPDKFQFVPRVQPLALLEAKQRLWLTFHCKLDQFWSMYGQKIKYPITIRDQQVDLSDLNYILLNEVKAAGSLENLSMDRWKDISTKLEFPTFDTGLAFELRETYETLIFPMEEFASYVNLKVKNHGQLQEDQCNKTAPKKRRMMAGFRRSNSNKKMMKTTSSTTVYSSDFNFDTLNSARVDLSCCRKCGVNVNLESRKTISCGSCSGTFHENCCIDSPPTRSSHLVSNRHNFKCRGCIAYRVYHDLLLTFGFHDSEKKFNLSDFADYADTYKKMYFGVDDTTQVGEREIEEEFWKNVLNPNRPVTVFYGADLHSREVGSGFPTAANNNGSEKKWEIHEDDVEETSDAEDFKKYSESGWNLNNFPKLNESILRHIGSNVSGMTQPWIYIGMVFSAFCWHVEDHWTPSINYNHFGETKTWYGIPGSQAESVDRCIKEYVPSLFHLQPDLMYNLNTMIHPNVLAEAGIKVSRVDQRSGEFVVTFPRGYHAGFNQGFNCAEAVNFATGRWLPLGFDCIQKYASDDIKRTNVFSHEELLVKLLSNPESLSLNDAKEAYIQLSLFIGEEKQLYDELGRLGVKTRKRVKIEEIENDDERTCFFCSRTLFFSMITCSCRANLPSKLRQSCREHFHTLCNCAISKRQFQFRYTFKELIELDKNFYARIFESAGMIKC